MSLFTEFVAGLESMQIPVTTENLSLKDQVAVESVYGNVKSFLHDNNLVSPNDMASLESFDHSIKSLNNTVNLNDLGQESIAELVRNCGIDDNHVKAACESVALAIHHYSNGYGAGHHFKTSSPAASHGDFEVRSLESMFSKYAVENMTTEPGAALETFGSDMTNVVSDAKVAVTVSLLRYHRSLIHRMIPNIPTDQNMVTFNVDHAEVYDMTKSRSNDAAVRYEDRHRIPFVDLYHDPNPANTTLKPIVLREANDGAAPNNKLLSENIVKIGTGLNMLDYSLDPGMVGYQHVDYTDLVADDVRIKTLYFEVTDGVTTEMVPMGTYDSSGARFMMSANNREASDRVASLNDLTTMTNTTTLADGSLSTLLAGLSADGVVRVKASAAGQVNLRTSETIVHGSADTSLVTKSGNEPITADSDLFNSLDIKLVGYELHAEFSEENVRKSTKAMRILNKQVGYEIPASTNYLVQYSLTQSRPEAVVDGLTKLMSVGIDDRGIKLIMDTFNNVYDRINREAALAEIDNYVTKVGQDFVAGQRVKPYIYMDTLEIDTAIENMRSGERWGDIRGVAEEFLLNVIVRMMQYSFYSMELGAGEKPVFTVLTSGPIKDSLLSIPHYHNHLGDNSRDATSDGVVEYRRTLPNGAVLNVITSTFDYLTNRMILFPVRPNRPQSVLNAFSNRERGTYIVQATPGTLGGEGITNALIGNCREIPLAQCPVGAILQVSGLHRVFDGMDGLGAE